MWHATVSSRAPAIDETTLHRYRTMANAMAESPQRHCIIDLCEEIGLWMDDGRKTIPCRFTEPHCKHMGASFDSLSGEEREAAFHLLWYAMEFARGRQPQTLPE